MKTLKSLLTCTLALLLFIACKPDNEKYSNRNAIWLWGSHMKEAPVQEWADKGYGHILLNEAAFTRWGEDSVYAFIADCEELGMTVHIWFQCFYEDGKWISPIDDENKRIDQDYYTKVINRAIGYVNNGVDGIHLDYIRYGGTAYKHDYPECHATYSITEFCRQLNVAVKALNPQIILSAALMPEVNSEYYYGQNPAEMGKYLDILMPMVYRYGYAGEDKPLSWVEEVCNWFSDNSGGAEVWAGIQTYTLDLTRQIESPIPMDAEHIYNDCVDIMNTKADGIVLFRHGIGEFPDVNNLCGNKTVSQAPIQGSAKSVKVKEFNIAKDMYYTVLVDVRSSEEHAQGFIPGTDYNFNVQSADFEQQILNTIPKDSVVAIYCKGGNRSKKAMEILFKNGYNVIELSDGITGWIEAEKEIETR